MSSGPSEASRREYLARIHRVSHIEAHLAEPMAPSASTSSRSGSR